MGTLGDKFFEAMTSKHSAGAQSGIPIGFIEHRVEKDNYQNDVSLIRMCGGRTFRMVHFMPNHKFRQSANIYAGRGKFVKVNWFCSERPTDTTWIKFFYGQEKELHFEWGDGDLLLCEIPDDLPKHISESLREFTKHEPQFSDLIVHLLSHLENEDSLWRRKETKAQTSGEKVAPTEAKSVVEPKEENA